MSVARMRAADAASRVPEATLVRRAGTALSMAALARLGTAYGRHVVVLAGTGNNGADGLIAGAVLARRGAAVHVVRVGRHTGSISLPPCDLVIDAVLGTGFTGEYEAPLAPPGAIVIAVDIPSGVDGDTGAAPRRPMAADLTVTFAAWKPGLLQGDGPGVAGAVKVADIGLDVGSPPIHLMEHADIGALLPGRSPASHKWSSAVAVVAGSPGMEGAAVLASTAAARAGAGLVLLGVPGGGAAAWPVEAVRLHLPEQGWADVVLREAQRCRAVVVGPGLGRTSATAVEVRSLVARCPVPVVVDADALFALGDAAAAREVLAGSRPVILTPHDGEYERLLGSAPGPDRVAAARRLAGLGAVGLVKGSLTAVGAPEPAPAPAGDVEEEVGAPGASGESPVLLCASGSARLATAGTGDVLSGIIGAFCARGMPALEAAALAAHVHGEAAARGYAQGLVSPDLPGLVAEVLSDAVTSGARRGAVGTSRG